MCKISDGSKRMIVVIQPQFYQAKINPDNGRSSVVARQHCVSFILVARASGNITLNTGILNSVRSSYHQFHSVK